MVLFPLITHLFDYRLLAIELLSLGTSPYPAPPPNFRVYSLSTPRATLLGLHKNLFNFSEGHWTLFIGGD